MVAGHLQEKNGFFYIVLNFKDDLGKRHTPWIPTKLPVKGNKKRAEAMLLDMRQNYILPASTAEKVLMKKSTSHCCSRVFFRIGFAWQRALLW